MKGVFSIMQNIAYIDLDEIFKKAYINMRLFDIKHIIKNMAKDKEFEKIFVFADFTSKEFLANIKKDLEDMQVEYPIVLVDGYNDTEEKNLTDIVLINTFYQNLIASNDEDDIYYTFVMAGTKYLSMLEYVQSITGKKVNLIIGDDVPYVDKLSETFNIVDKIELQENKKTIEDKLVIREIFNVVKWGEDNKYWMTFKNVIEKCKTMSNIRENDTYFMLNAMIAKKLLERRKLIHQDEGIQYKVLVIGESELVEKFLSVHKI